MSDELTLTPVYQFEWTGGTSRVSDETWSPAAVEALASFGRADPECEVTLLEMGA